MVTMGVVESIHPVLASVRIIDAIVQLAFTETFQGEFNACAYHCFVAYVSDWM